MIVEHDSATHQLRVVGRTSFDACPHEPRARSTTRYRCVRDRRRDTGALASQTETWMNCPKCQSAMAPVKVGIVEVDRCTSCGGMWFDSLEEEWLKTPGRCRGARCRRIRPSAQKLNVQGRIDCPEVPHPHHPHGRRRAAAHLVRVVQGLLRPLLRRRRVSATWPIAASRTWCAAGAGRSGPRCGCDGAGAGVAGYGQRRCWRRPSCRSNRSRSHIGRLRERPRARDRRRRSSRATRRSITRIPATTYLSPSPVGEWRRW